MKKVRWAAGLLAAVLSVGVVHADDTAELLRTKQTTLQLLKALVQRGVLTPEQAREILSQAEVAAQQAQEETSAADTPQPGDVRVPYVPEFIQDKIREQVRRELREEVVQDVLSHAKQERWGVPGATPSWVERIKWSGDIRLRAQGDVFADANQLDTILDPAATNAAGAVRFANSTVDRERLRARLRLGMKAQVSEGYEVGARIATGKFSDSVSTNQTLETADGPYRVVLDRAYLKYRSPTSFLTVTGGRMPNPWFSTDLVWDGDLNFDGVAVRLLPRASDDLEIDERRWQPFITLGAFPLEETEISSRDKWLFGAQTGFEWRFSNQSTLKLGVAYYDFHNIEGVRNPLNQRTQDFTAPAALQRGNTLFNIRTDAPTPSTRLALASDYDELNVTAAWDLAYFAPVHVIVTADYVKNLGFDLDAVRARTGGAATNVLAEETEGYQIQLTVGWPEIWKRGDWQVYTAYKHLEQDAVVDAYTDSDFHLGGTNAEGWVLGGRYGMSDNTWLNLRYLTADEIQGPSFGVDVIQLDINARF